MTLSYRVDDEAGILYWVSVGADTEEDWVRVGGEAIEKLYDSPHLGTLVDHRDHDPTLPSDYIRKVISWIPPSPSDIQPKWAFVVTGDLTFGLARMAASHLELKGFQARVFTDYELAEDWLKER